MNTVTCPDCKGEKVTRGYACPGFRLIESPCGRCKGEGTISEEMVKWIEHGVKIRQAMHTLRRTTREEAALRGMKAADWSAMMFGKVYNLDQEIPK